MGFAAVTRFSLEVLNQNYRAPVVLPRPVPPSRGDAPAVQDASYKVADDFIRLVPFVRAGGSDRPVARQYQVRTAEDLFEPPFTARGGAGTTWVQGASTPFGQEFDIAGTRFKKVSTVFRDDPLMEQSMRRHQEILAGTAVVRAMSDAAWNSFPSNDDQSELAGFRYYLPAASPQHVTYDPARKLLGGLAEIIARCCPSDGDFGVGPDVIVTTSRVIWRLVKEHQDKGIDPVFEYCPLTAKKQLHYCGVPLVTGRIAEPAGTTSTTEAWAIKITGDSAVRFVHVGGDSDNYGLQRRSTTVSWRDASGEVEGSSPATEVYAIVSVLVPEEQAVAVLQKIPTADPYAQP
ncbi:hypothetical protein [Bradyrhizobium prioriisuperbiae]|uniref:hypothetical protein n=1 Tax=Bradyrhizobium prioriisuperbiae TaxID=2854389 RepID=UPI0028E22DA7|nr:hypothetical protein [Bradyrhizobium prioritasuperba]